MRILSLVTQSLYEMPSILPKASNFHCLDSPLRVCGEGSRFTGIQEDGHDEQSHQSCLGTDRDVYLSRLASVLLALLLSVQFWPLFLALNLHL